MDFNRKPTPKDIMVYEGRKQLAPGSYVEWLESLGAPITKHGWCTHLCVYILKMSPIEEMWYFTLRGDDCTVACYEYNTKTRKFVCSSAFVDDDEEYEITDEQFNASLKEYCEKHGLTPKFRN